MGKEDSRRPVIAIARARATDDYIESVRRAGGEPLVVFAGSEDAARLWDRVSGLLLTGGPDVDPRLYREAPDPSFEPAGQDRDAFEIELVTRAIEHDVPIFAICRGMQVMNVAAGGTLIQHIPADVPRALEHQLKHPSWAIAHHVDVDGASLLARTLALPPDSGTHRVDVNSRHHQAVRHVAPGFVVTATAPDGVIEAFERTTSRFCVGVQWHPENFWRTGEFDALFGAFVQACLG
jgi:putative glutamine amidotransferase